MRAIARTFLALLLATAMVDERVSAASITAASCNAADVQAALTKAAAGDTVHIPAGTCRWTSGISWSAPANVTVVGAGNMSVVGGGDATVIIDDYASSNPLMGVTVSGTFRLAGLTIRGGSGSLKETGVVVLSGNSAQVRLDHLHINMQTAADSRTKPLRFIGPMTGVFDHNIVDLAELGWIHFQGDIGGSNGDPAWAAATDFGSSKFIFIEDNLIRGQGNAILTDCNAGGRFVIRYNTIIGAQVGQTHPTGGAGRGRGCRAHELYGNTVTPNPAFNPATQQPLFTFSWMTSGTSLVWGNTANGVYKWFINADVMRRDSGSYGQAPNPNGWGYCGTEFTGVGSGWDGNTNTTSGYPCLDQPGRGRGDLLTGDFPNAVNSRTGRISSLNQALEPVYEWSNAFTSVVGWGNDSSIRFASNAGARLVQNRDYFLDSPSFSGASGVGSGSRAARPATCTTGVAYWSTDQGGDWNNANGSGSDGTLDVCSAANTWTNAAYTPFQYPHPLAGNNQTSLSPMSGPAPPQNVHIVQ